MTLSILFSMVKNSAGGRGAESHSGRLDPHPKTITTSQGGGGIRVPRKHIQVFFGKLGSQSTLTVAQANIWWYCGGPLFETLLVKWSGTCTFVQLAIPFTLEFQ
jgi:hypothetical protein